MPRVALFLLAALLAFGAASRAEATGWENRRLKFSLGYHFSTGKYGESRSTQIGFVPLVTRAELGNASFEVTIPYLRVDGPAGTTATTGSGVLQTTGGRQDGLGDITGRGAYTVPPLVDWMPFVDLIARVKFPTASRSRGLGSGEFDFGLETEFLWMVDRWVPFVAGGYRWLGSSSSLPLRDVWLASAGAMYRFVPSLWGGLSLDYRQAATATSGERLELVPFVSWRLGAHWSVDPYVSAGLATGSPAFGIGLQLGYTL